jgi:hypothetical protein
MDKYECELDSLKSSLSEAESLRLVEKLQAEEQTNALKRQLASAQKALSVAQQNASIAEKNAAVNANLPAAAAAAAALNKQGSATQQQQQQPQIAFAQPGPSSSSSSSSSSVAVASALPALVIPGVIELKESEELLSAPVISSLPLCGACQSRDRGAAEKMRSLCNHARKTLEFQSKQIAELKNSVAIYEMQFNEYQNRKR